MVDEFADISSRPKPLCRVVPIVSSLGSNCEPTPIARLQVSGFESFRRDSAGQKIEPRVGPVGCKGSRETPMECAF